MKSSDYWKERFALLEESQHRQGLSCYAEIETQYRTAQKELERQIDSWYRRFATENKITMAEARRWLTGRDLTEFQWDVNEYIKYGRENAVNGQWMKQLENASARYHISRLEALQLQTQQALEVMFGNQTDTIDTAMRDIYTSGYYQTAFEIQKGVGTGWNLATLDDKLISKVIKKPWAADGKNFSERIWGNRQRLVNELNQTLTQGIILGQDPQKAIDSIAKKMNTSKVNAGRLVMTEQAYFAGEARKDCFKELDVEEFEVVATLDSRTSEICQDMDGKHFPMSQWEVGVTAPPFHVNCRSCTAPYFEDDFGVAGMRAARAEDGSTYEVPADMTYKEWKGQFVDGNLEIDTSKMQNYSDVTEQWKRNIAYVSNPVSELYSYTINGTTHIVDGHKVVLSPSINEKRIAVIMTDTFGGTIQFVPRILSPQGVKTPDYIFNGEKYDLKTIIGTSNNVLYNSLKGKREQAENFIFDITNNQLSVDNLTEQAKRIFKSKNRDFVKRIILISGDEVLNVFERK